MTRLAHAQVAHGSINNKQQQQQQHLRRAVVCATSTGPFATLAVPTTSPAAVGATAVRGWFKPGLAEPTLDKQVGDVSRKGPPVAHALPVYKKAHKLLGSQRWKTANLVTNVVSGKDFRLRDSHGEGRVDETGQYRDWLYGDERRFANYLGITLFCTSASLFWYTVKTMGSETWDIPTPLLVKPPPTAGSRELEEAKAMLASPPPLLPRSSAATAAGSTVSPPSAASSSKA